MTEVKVNTYESIIPTKEDGSLVITSSTLGQLCLNYARQFSWTQLVEMVFAPAMANYYLSTEYDRNVKNGFIKEPFGERKLNEKGEVYHKLTCEVIAIVVNPR